MLLHKFSNQLRLPTTTNPRHHNYLGPGFDGTIFVEQGVLHEARCFLSFHIMRYQRWHRWWGNLRTTGISCAQLVGDQRIISEAPTQLLQRSKPIYMIDRIHTVIYPLNYLQVAKVGSGVGGNDDQVPPRV
jgi:hypothetical protein